MNKKLGRLFWPSLWLYLFVMAGFVAAAVILKNYLLAGIEAAALLLVIAYYLFCRSRRHREVRNFVRSVLGESDGGTRGSQKLYDRSSRGQNDRRAEVAHRRSRL